MSLDSTIRELRERKGVSARIMAPQASFDSSYVRNIENEHVIPSEEVLRKLPDYSHYDKDELVLLANRIPDDIFENLRTRPGEAIGQLRECFG